jgi:hypothetical protein
MDRESTTDQRSLLAIIGGSVLTSSALASPSTGRRWAVALGLACMAAGCICHSGSRRLTAALGRLLRPSASQLDDAIDRASSDSFPASDAPASIPAAEPPT